MYPFYVPSFIKEIVKKFINYFNYRWKDQGIPQQIPWSFSLRKLWGRQQNIPSFYYYFLLYSRSFILTKELQIFLSKSLISSISPSPHGGSLKGFAIILLPIFLRSNFNLIFHKFFFLFSFSSLCGSHE